MHRWLSIALLLVAPAALAVPRDELSEVERDLNSSKQAAQALAEKLAANQKDLDALSTRAAQLAIALQASEARVEASEKKTEAVEAERDEKQREFDERREQFAHTLGSLMAFHQLPVAAMLSGGDTLESMLKTASALEHTNQALAERTAALKQHMEQLNQAKQRARDQRAELERGRKQLASDQQKLDQQLEARKTARAQLSTDKQAAEARIEALSKQAKNLQDLLQRLEREPRFGRSRLATEQWRSAAAAKGQLRVPITGSVLHRFGERKNENETYRGLVLKARSGGTVVAPFEGEVVFTGPFRDYGRMVLIKHGGGIITLLAGLGAIDVDINQRITKGEPLGRMPGTPAPPLYLELRDGSKPIDPADWFANLPQR